ncbi:MAG TPA: methyltransferase domain-containing protein [Pyrinomonadaceae bacterium]
MKSSVYDEGDIHRRYDRARGLPEEATRLWLDRLAPHVPRGPGAAVLDVGCGTGRFTLALAERFDARVYGVEPSAKMIGVAAERVAASRAAPRVSLVRGAAERIPLRDAVAGLALLSMVYHHFADRDSACAELRRVLPVGGRLAVRTATRERVDTFLWHRFFPEARELDLRRLPPSGEPIARLESHGFALTGREVVRQLFARDLAEYHDKISRRALSSLQSITDEAFARGLSELRNYCDTQRTTQPVHEEIDLFIFSAV